MKSQVLITSGATGVEHGQGLQGLLQSALESERVSSKCQVRNLLLLCQMLELLLLHTAKIIVIFFPGQQITLFRLLQRKM